MTFNADDSAANAIERFDDGVDDKIVVGVTIVYGVDTSICGFRRNNQLRI
jgi:hypothetical protein